MKSPRISGLNGAVITHAVRQKFLELPPRKVEVSLYGATAATYEAVTQVPGSHARCMEGIRWLYENGIALTLKTVLMRENRHELDAMRAMANRFAAPFYFDTAIFPCLPHADNGARANARRSRSNVVEVAPPRREPLELRLTPEASAAAQISRTEVPAKPFSAKRAVAASSNRSLIDVSDLELASVISRPVMQIFTPRPGRHRLPWFPLCAGEVHRFR